MFTIGAVARQTGITPATLRKWETRYGFPIPLRTAGDHRAFHPSDLDALIEISRRMAAGQRAGVAIQTVKMGLQKATPGASLCPVTPPPEVSHALSLLRQNDLSAFENCLSSHLEKHGASVFARDLAIPLIEAVGSLWQEGRLPVYAEHLFSGILQRVAQQPFAAPVKPSLTEHRVLLASPAGESHTLALVLLNAVLHEASIPTVFLQGGLPAAEIAAAAQAYKVQVVALSASVACPSRLLTAELRILRRLLDSRTGLWIGGAGTHKISSPIDGVKIMRSLDTAVQSLQNSSGQGPNNVGLEEDRYHG